MKPKTLTQVETITPQKAEEYLKTNVGHQRNVTTSHVLHLSQQMMAGQWQMNGESIIFDSSGHMIDGQHRMHAVIKSGMSVDMMVVRGVDPSSFMTINRGKIRTGGNIFTIAGYSNGNDISAACANVLNYRRAMKVKDEWESKPDAVKANMRCLGINPGSLNSYIRPSITDMMEEYEKNIESYSIAIGVSHTAKHKKLVMPSVISTVSALALIDAKHNPDEVSFFWEKFASGEGLAQKDPIFAFREKCISNASSKAKLSQPTLLMYAIKSWNAYITGKSISVIRVIDGEPCPTII